MFSLELLQAVNDWQCGGTKTPRGKRLKKLSGQLATRFREVRGHCFRQISLDKASLWLLGTELHLPEVISGWTLSIDVAKSFKGGVPSSEWQVFIFEIKPRPEQVVVNLDELYRDPGFLSACEEMRPQISRFHDGIGKYGGLQHEVVLEVDRLDLKSSTHAMGGYSSDRKGTARFFFGPEPTEEELQAFDQLMVQAGRKLGAAWVEGPAKDRVVESFIANAKVLKARAGQP
jgi:hypothetical protein